MDDPRSVAFSRTAYDLALSDALSHQESVARVRVAAVVPARAGVFRCRAPRGVPGRCGPRAGGGVPVGAGAMAGARTCPDESLTSRAPPTPADRPRQCRFRTSPHPTGRVPAAPCRPRPHGPVGATEQRSGPDALGQRGVRTLCGRRPRPPYAPAVPSTPLLPGPLLGSPTPAAEAARGSRPSSGSRLRPPTASSRTAGSAPPSERQLRPRGWYSGASAEAESSADG